MTAEHDPRAGKPSCSWLPRLEECPGSWLKGKDVNDTSEDADSGNRVHADLAGEEVELNPIETETADQCREQVIRLRDTFLAQYEEPVYERRLWSGDDWSGQLDLMIPGYDAEEVRSMLIVDYKTLWGKHKPAPKNRQILGEAVLVARNMPEFERFYCAIVQPVVTSNPEVALFNRDQVDQAGLWCDEQMAKAYDGGERRAGLYQCAMCSGRNTCDEYAEWASRNLPIPTDGIIPPAEWTVEQYAKFLDAKPLATNWITDRYAEAKQLIEEGKIDGWFARDQVSLSAKNPEKIWHLLAIEYGFSNEEIFKCASFSVPQIIDLVKRKKLVKKDVAKEWVEKLLNMHECSEINESKRYKKRTD